MDNNVLIALIGAASSELVAITALLLNYREVDVALVRDKVGL